VGGRDWGQWWARHGPALPAALRAGIECEMARLLLVKAHIKTLEAQQGTAVAAGQQPQAAQLSRVRGLGLGGAWILVQGLFGWRRFHNRRQVARCVGLVPTPYSSGESQTEQGIAKAGNQRARRIMVQARVELAALSTGKRFEPVVQPAFRSRWQADAAHWHRSAGPALGDCTVALFWKMG